MKFIFVFLVITGLANAQTSTQESEYQSIQKLAETVKDLSNFYLFCNRSSACKALPVGRKACGGPSDYLVVSKNNRNYKEISYMAKRTRVREHNYNTRYPGEGDCEFVMRPETNCINHRCAKVSSEQE